MRQTRAAFLHSAELEKHSYPPACPFRTDRASKTRDLLTSMGLLSGAGRRVVAPKAIPREVSETFHAPDYLDVLQDASRGKLDATGLAMGLGTPDCPVFRGLYDYAALAAGASVAAADLILTGDVDVAFNPSGGYHHAHRAAAAGFCYVNDVVLACMRLADRGRRVLFLDVDVHHCDGVQEAFYRRRDVLTLSFHQDGRTLFPGTGRVEDLGAGDGTGYSLNIPLPPGTGDEAYLRAFRAVGPPLIDAYQPDAIVLELGMDALAGDPLADLSLTNNTYADLLHQVVAAGKPILATGGGGYNVDNTVRGWALAWSVLCGSDDHDDDLAAGLGGVMLESAEWRGGLRDRRRVADPDRQREVNDAVNATIEAVRKSIFPLHGI